MKLFVWVDPYPVNMGSSLLIAVAASVKEAKRQAAQGAAYSYGEYPCDASWRAALSDRLGDPSRVVDLPCAEWHEWSE